LLRYGWILPAAALLVGAGVLVLTYAFASIPLPQDINPDSSAEVFDVRGRLIGTFSGEVRRFLIDTQELLEKKPFIGQAVVAAEDREFYDHNGVSVRGIVRAAWANITGGEIAQGGSTITQQYVKNAVLQDPSRTVTRKVKEAVLAIKLERRYDKDQILGFYLNTIYLGRGAYGIEAAARSYFDKHADELTLGEAAYLAGIIPSPESYQPDENPQGARQRRDLVLERLEARGDITQAEFAEASEGRVRLARGAAQTTRRSRAAYFMEWLRKEYLFPEFGNDLYTGGLKIYTTLDLDMQASAEEAVRSTFEQVLPDGGGPQAALVSTTPTGAVRALVGGKRNFDNIRKARQFNFATTFPGRQAGSAFKPFTLMTAIEEDISPQSRFSGSSPRTITDEECYTNGLPWQVDNFGGSSFGTLTLDQATTNSVNTIYAQLVAEVGAEKVAEMVEEFGFKPKNGEKEIQAICSLALGTLDVTPMEMARAYSVFAARGALSKVQPIRFITDSEGDCLKSYRPGQGEDCDDREPFERDQIVDQNSADVVNEVLTHVVQGGTATAANIGRPVAGKTGTTQNNVSAWFGGYVPQLTATVWMGYPAEQGGNGTLVPQMRTCSDLELCRPIPGYGEITGGSLPAQIWAAYMSQAVADMPVENFVAPSDLPDEIINSPAPAPAPTATKSPEPSPTAIETVEPTTEPSPAPAPSPTETGILPSPQPTGGDRREDDP
jgi:penicillin-binding protein 1A